MPRRSSAYFSRVQNLAAATAARAAARTAPARATLSQKEVERQVVEDVKADGPERLGLDLRLSVLQDGDRVAPMCVENFITPEHLFHELFAAERICRECGEELTLSVKSIGMEPAVSVSCTICEEVVFSHKPMTKMNIGEVSCKFTPSSLRAVHHCLTNGQGYVGYHRLQSDLALPLGLSKQPFLARCKFLYAAMDAFVAEWRQPMWHAIANFYDADGGLLDIHVSYDKTWMNKWHTSPIGIGFVIECHTGFIVDMEVLNNYCELCTKKKNALAPDAFDAWKASHTNCKKNFRGKSEAMETAAAVRLWGRSQELGYRYKVLVGDRDSSAFNAVMALNDGRGPYSIQVEKQDCLNHVGNRLPLKEMNGNFMDETTVKVQVRKNLRLKCLKSDTANFDRVRYNALNIVLQHNFGDERGSLLTRLGLQTEDTVGESSKRDLSRTRVKSQPKKRRREDESGSSSDSDSGEF